MAGPKAVSCGIEEKNLPKGKLLVLGRFLYALIFLFGGASHFSKQTIAYAASQGVPLAPLVVPLSGIFAIAGGLSILLGYRAKFGAGLIMLFLVRTILNDGQVLGYARPADGPDAHGAVHGKRRLDWRCIAHFPVWSRPVQR
jgi:DoxX